MTMMGMRMRMRMGMRMEEMLRVSLLVVALGVGASRAILPELLDSGGGHVSQQESGEARPEVEVEVEQLPEGDGRGRDAAPAPAAGGGAPHDDEWEQLHTNNMETSSQQPGQLNNHIHTHTAGCSSDAECVKGTFCQESAKCVWCKAEDVPCSRDEQCCGDQLCVWGQCRPNATRGEAGATCRRQGNCGAELCCALHPALQFAVCSARPIERERCVAPSNHLMALLSWDHRDGRPRAHCPCAAGLRCQHLGRGSMCLKSEEWSEEELADTLYSEIDYII